MNAEKKHYVCATKGPHMREVVTPKAVRFDPVRQYSGERRADQVRRDVDALQAARDTSNSASNDDGNVGSAFALNTATRRGRARRAHRLTLSV